MCRTHLSDLEALIILVIGSATHATLPIMRRSSTPKRGKMISDNRKQTAPPLAATAELGRVTAGYRLWLVRQPLSPNTRRTYLGRHLEHAGGAEPRTPDLLVHCHASILAQACNFGLTRMAQLADLSYRQLAWCTTCYLREETLQPAIASIVNHHYRHPLARLWGGGTLSSSDDNVFR